MISFSPPQEELTLHVRRDKKEYPFLEKLYNWATNFHGYAFTNANPSHIRVPNPNVPEDILEDLGSVPYLLVEALQIPSIVQKITNDFSKIGYPVKHVTTSKRNIPGGALEVPFVEVHESDLLCSTSQNAMSNGMFRAFSLIVIIEHILNLNMPCTVAIDDLGEGLDYERAAKIVNLLFEKVKNTEIQMIATSNDRFLINAVDVKYLNLLERNGPVVSSYSYANNKEKFDEFELTGLNNFDFFSRKMYKENKDD